MPVKLRKKTEYYKGVISTQERKQSRVPCHCGLFFFVPTSVCKVRGKDSKHETKKNLKKNLKKKLKKTKKRHFYVAGNDYVGVLVPFSLDGIVNNARGLPL